MADAPAEVRALVTSFEDMRERLNAAFAALTQFSTELAHEFRTPLHVLRQQTEIALARPRTPDEYREVLGSCLEEVDRLHRMVDDILFLARAEDPRSRIDATSLAVAAACYAAVLYTSRTPFGLSLQAIRDNARRMEAVGYNVAAHRIAA